jgi:hypothetical protein
VQRSNLYQLRLYLGQGRPVQLPLQIAQGIKVIVIVVQKRGHAGGAIYLTKVPDGTVTLEGGANPEVAKNPCWVLLQQIMMFNGLGENNPGTKLPGTSCFSVNLSGLADNKYSLHPRLLVH